MALRKLIAGLALGGVVIGGGCKSNTSKYVQVVGTTPVVAPAPCPAPCPAPGPAAPAPCCNGNGAPVAVPLQAVPAQPPLGAPPVTQTLPPGYNGRY